MSHIFEKGQNIIEFNSDIRWYQRNSFPQLLLSLLIFFTFQNYYEPIFSSSFFSFSFFLLLEKSFSPKQNLFPFSHVKGGIIQILCLTIYSITISTILLFLESTVMWEGAYIIRQIKELIIYFPMLFFYFFFKDSSPPHACINRLVL